MKTIFIMMIVPFFLFSPVSAQDTPAQDEFFDGEAEEEDGPNTAEPVANEGEPVNNEGKPPGRFGRNRDGNRNPPGSAVTPKPTPPPAASRFQPPPVNNRPTTKVGEIEVEEKVNKKKKKISFATAQPEDITNENFPELIKSFD